MTTHTLRLVPGLFAICNLPVDTPLADLTMRGSFWSVARSPGELTLVVPEEHVAPDWQVEPGWRCLEVAGPLDFSLTGVLSNLTTLLAEAEISVFAVSTYSTDYLLVKNEAIDRACEVLSEGRHIIEEPDGGES